MPAHSPHPVAVAGGAHGLALDRGCRRRRCIALGRPTDPRLRVPDGPRHALEIGRHIGEARAPRVDAATVVERYRGRVHARLYMLAVQRLSEPSRIKPESLSFVNSSP